MGFGQFFSGLLVLKYTKLEKLPKLLTIFVEIYVKNVWTGVKHGSADAIYDMQIGLKNCLTIFFFC